MISPAFLAQLCQPAAVALRAQRARRSRAVRVRRPVSVSQHARRGGVAGKRGAGRRGPAAVPPAQGGRCGTRRRHRAVRRGLAGRRRGAAGAGQAKPHQAHRPTGAHGGSRAGGAQSGDFRGRRAARSLLRARSVVADCLLDRRQRGGKLRRRALPEIRADGAQHPQAACVDHRRASCSKSAAMRSTARATTCWR